VLVKMVSIIRDGVLSAGFPSIAMPDLANFTGGLATLVKPGYRWLSLVANHFQY
jgi:hypothetical protein